MGRSQLCLETDSQSSRAVVIVHRKVGGTTVMEL